MFNCLSNDEAKMDPAITNGFGFVSAFAMFLPTITWRRRYGAVQLRTEFYEFSVMNRARLCEEEEGGAEAWGIKPFGCFT